tara:strand:+ start:87 stop:449 length:363 start_codon:yes stop_codon:yes gene_type:complete
MDKKTNKWSFEIPDVHPSLNIWTNMHWTKKSVLKKYWENMVWALAREAGLKKIDKPVWIFIQYYHPRRTVDLDNYTPKFILDGLKSFIKDDNIQWIQKIGWEFIQSKKKKSIVEIQEIRP